MTESSDIFDTTSFGLESVSIDLPYSRSLNGLVKNVENMQMVSPKHRS